MENYITHSHTKSIETKSFSEWLIFFGSNWKFVFAFFVSIVLWVSVNIYFITNTIFYYNVFITLNIALSFLVLIKAFVIVYSLNKQVENEAIH